MEEVVRRGDGRMGRGGVRIKKRKKVVGSSEEDVTGVAGKRS